jgi:hypothetical protein
MDSLIVQPDSVLSDLMGLFPADERMSLHCNLQKFMDTYYESRVLMNTIARIELPISTSRNVWLAAQFSDGMREYALRVMDRSNI